MTQSEKAITEFDYEAFCDGKVFEYLFQIKDPYDQAMAERTAAMLANSLQFKNFTRLFRLYKQQHTQKNLPVITTNGLSEFGNQTIELDVGEWTANDMGVYKHAPGANGTIWACSHVIYPSRRIRSIDTKTLKYELTYRRNEKRVGHDEKLIIDASDMSSPTEIVKKLAPYGVSVTGGDRAKALVDYLRDTTDRSYEIIPEVKSVSRMGWNEEGFSPYVDDVVFDGATAFSGAYRAINQVGSFDKWLEEAKDARTYSITSRIVLAASFAAPLVEPLGVLPFFVHLWSTASGTGKTVGQMLGASVWANPTPGGAFFPTFRSTSVGLEMMAGFLHSLPMFIDELQLAKDSHGNVRFNVYELASGSGKLRSNKALGLNYTPTWAMCFITSGETPIVSENDGEGALNRVFEIECYADKKVINDGHRTSNALKQNYGWAGKMFIDKLTEGGSVERAKTLYDEFFQACTANDTTEKQAMAAACILTSDALATEWIFQDGNALTVSDISEFLKTRERVSLMERGYETICDWISINANKLRGIRDDDRGECYGLVDGDTACIIRSVFNRVCADNGISEKGLLSHLRSKGLIETNGKGFTKSKRIGTNQVANCVWLKLPADEVIQLRDDELPF